MFSEENSWLFPKRENLYEKKFIENREHRTVISGRDFSYEPDDTDREQGHDDDHGGCDAAGGVCVDRRTVMQ